MFTNNLRLDRHRATQCAQLGSRWPLSWQREVSLDYTRYTRTLQGDHTVDHPMSGLASAIASAETASDKTSFPDFPAENPSKHELKEWLDVFKDDLITAGFGPVLRGETPRECAKLVDRVPLTLPSEPAAAVVAAAENAKIDAFNKANQLERESVVREYHSRLGAKIAKALKPMARLRLDGLKTAHPLKQADGVTVVPNAYHGKDMWDALEGLHADDDGEGMAKKRQQRVEEIRDTKLPDNVSPQQFADVMVEFNEINELIDQPYTGAAYSKLVIGIIPENLEADERALKRELNTAGLANHTDVVQKVKKLIASAHKPDAQPMMKMTVAAHEKMMKDMKAASEKAAKEAAKNAVAFNFANNNSNQNGTGDKRGKGNGKPKSSASRLPDGQTCSSGTCNFNHDKKKPGADCFRDPRKKVTLPQEVYDDEKQRGRIEADRKTQATRLKVNAQPLVRGPPRAATRDSTSAGGTPLSSPADGALSLTDFFNTSCMLECADESEQGYIDSQLGGLESPIGDDRLDRLELTYSDNTSQLDDDGSGRVFTTPEGKKVVKIDDTDAAYWYGKTAPAAPPAAAQVQSSSTDGVAADSHAPTSSTNSVPPSNDSSHSSTPRDTATDERVKQPLVDAVPDQISVSAVLRFLIHLMVATSAVCMVALLLTVVASLLGGQPVATVASNVMLVIGCHGGKGISQSFALSTAACEMSPVHTHGGEVLKAITCLAMGIPFMWNARIVELLTRVIFMVLVRVVRFVFRQLLNPHNWREQIKFACGTLGAMLLFFLLIRGASGAVVGSPVVMDGHSFYSRAVHVSRDATALLPPFPGNAVRSSLDSLSYTLIDNVSIPAVAMDASDAKSLARIAGITNTEYRLLDSGSAFEVVRSTKGAIDGSIRKNTTSVSTANGVTTPTWRCDVPMKIGMRDGSVRTVVRRNALVMPQCAHELVSAGNLAKNNGINTLIASGNETRLIFPDGACAPVFNMGVTVLPVAKGDWASRAAALGSACALNAPVVTQGGRRTRAVSSRILHLRGNHSGHRVLNDWHKCTNAPKHWHVTEEPCHDCLVSNSSSVPSDEHAPIATSPGQYCSFDVYDIGVPHVHGGHRKVFGMHDLYSKFNWVTLMKNESESEVLRCLQEWHAFCSAANVTCKHLHTDNFASYLTPKVRQYVQNTMKSRYTQSCPDTPRSNGTSERQWRVMGNDTRRLLNHSSLPRNFAWYALRHSVDVRNTLPLRGDTSNCPYKLFLKRTPNVMSLRVWGCMVYPKIMHTAHKMANQSLPCIHLGRCPTQPGFLCYDPAARKLISSIHCRFVESSSPGLTINSRGGWLQAVPKYSDEYDPKADIVDGLGNPIGTPLDEDITAPDEPLVPSAPETSIPGLPPLYAPVPPVAPPTPPTVSHHTPHVQRGVNEPPASVARSRRANTNPYASRARPSVGTFALLTAAALVRGLQPGGEAFGTQVLGFGNQTRPEGNFFIYLCSNKAREGDFEQHVRELSSAETVVINVDVERGGHSHDLSTDHVTNQLVEMANRSACVGVLCTVPCSTWSAARMADNGGPEPLRNRNHPFGIPDANGVIPRHVEKANSIATNAIKICKAAAKRGAHVIIENPVSRGKGSQFAIRGRELHSSLWDFPPMMEFAESHGMQVTVFDQCRVGASTQKTTQLLCSPSVHTYVNETLGPLICNHGPKEHAQLIGNAGSDGKFKTKAAEQFPSELNRTLAKAMLQPHTRSVGWVASIGSVIGSYTNRLVDVYSYTMAAVHMAEEPSDDALTLLRQIRQMRLEFGDDNEDWVTAAAETHVMEASRVAASLCCNADAKLLAGPNAHLPSIPMWGAFTSFVGKVSNARRGGSDDPSFREAMNGPERDDWLQAMEKEMHSLREHNVYEEVPEDSLDTWDSAKGKSGEVIDVMWVLKKKYNELRELLKFKARATSRGDLGAAVDQRYNRTPAETFAPTMRHSTFKTICAAGVCRAAKTGRSVRYQSGDVSVAFLRGTQCSANSRYLRPPPMFRSFDRRGVPIVWRLTGNLYGESSAPRIWHETAIDYCVNDLDGPQLKQSDADPCYLYKVYPDGTRLDIGWYVDDLWCVDDAGALADADLAKLTAKFGVPFATPKHFLNINVTVESPTRIKLSMEAYLLQMADRYVPNWREWPQLNGPCTQKLVTAYEKANLREHAIDPKIIERFRGKVGALMYASPSIRVDACATIGRLSRASVFATAELDDCADECIVYLAQTASDGITFDGNATDAGMLKAYSDSDWAVGHSTSGFCLMLANACIVHSSKRQACIAMSSTEAEIIAASACALELVHSRQLLRELGLEQGVTPLYVDNSGAVELSRDRKSCHRSRHVDRRYFKVRELSALGELYVHHIDTADNPADLLTKPLDVEAFRKHRNTLLRQSNAKIETKFVAAIKATTRLMKSAKVRFTLPDN